MEISGKTRARIVLIVAALIFAALSLSLPWYRIREGHDVQLYFMTLNEGHANLADLVALGVYAWIFWGFWFLFSIILQMRKGMILFGWLAMASAVVTLGYFYSEAKDTLSPQDFMGEDYDLYQMEYQVWGPSSGFAAAFAAAVVQTIVVIWLMNELFPEKEKKEEKPEGPFGE